MAENKKPVKEKQRQNSTLSKPLGKAFPEDSESMHLKESSRTLKSEITGVDKITKKEEVSDQNIHESGDIRESVSAKVTPAPETKTDPNQEEQRVYIIDDTPALEDLLGREPLAESLATRLKDMHKDDPASSFFLHIDGPWGAGKTTLLNFLGDKLGDEWLVVNFNAWREQRTGPPWWSLLSALRRSAYEKLGKIDSINLKISEFFISLSLIRIKDLIIPYITALLTICILYWLSAGNYSIKNLADIAMSFSAISAFVATIWSGSIALRSFLLSGSSKSAKTYVESTTDPMEGIAFRFRQFIKRIDRSVAIFIDDLDRCSEDYVVEFLEAIQTLIKEEPKVKKNSGVEAIENELELNQGETKLEINKDNFLEDKKKSFPKAPYFIIAADGRWIRTSYEKAYSIFERDIAYPGRPLGYLFTEKAFQLTTTLPNIDPELQQEYLKQLLKTQEPGQFRQELKNNIEKAKKILKDGGTDHLILDKVGNAEKEVNDPLFKFAIRGEAIKQMAQRSVAKTTEHELQKFWDLLDSNPRAMKRFVNAFGVERALRTIEGGGTVELEPLARWTIVLLRWPLMAELLRSDPSLVNQIGVKNLKKSIPEHLKSLFNDSEVIKVIKGTKPDHGPPLNEELIRKCCGILDFEST